jgi:hypothetical protein
MTPTKRRTSCVPIAYVIAWALFAFQRLLLFEIPFMPGPFCLVSGRRVAADPVSRRG